jgi:hypothetical protein
LDNVQIEINNVQLVQNAGMLKARVDFSFVLAPGTEKDPNAGKIRIYRAGYFRRENGETFVSGPTFNKGKDANGKDLGHLRAMSLPSLLNSQITATVEAAMATALGGASA